MTENKSKNRINQSDVAKLSGVSISTVSRVLANSPGISAPVRHQVRKAAQELGYRLPISNGHSDLRQLVACLTIERVTGSVAPMYQSIIEGIKIEAGRAGLDVIVRAINSQQKIPTDILERSGTGVFFVGLDPDSEGISNLKAKGTPVVLVNGLDPLMRADAIAPANFFGGHQVAHHLVELGHRQMLLLADSRRWTIRRRMEGFQTGLEELGMPQARTIDIARLDSDHGAEAIRNLLNEGKLEYTAAFCCSDAVALGAIEAMQENGFRVPQDFSVVGFDDMPYASMVSPLLTTVRVDWADMGIHAVKLIQAQSQRVGATALQVQISVNLIKRDSAISAPDQN